MSLKRDIIAFEKGKSAYFKGLLENENPYNEEEESDKYWSWDMGYQCAYEPEEFEYDFNAD